MGPLLCSVALERLRNRTYPNLRSATMDHSRIRQLMLITSVSFGSIVNAAMSASMPTAQMALVNQAEAVTTPAPSLQSYYGEMAKRQISSSYRCGVSGPAFTWHCITRSEVCAVSVYADGNAYAYCSNTDAGPGDQLVFTTAIASESSCIAPTGCWSVDILKS